MTAEYERGKTNGYLDASMGLRLAVSWSDDGDYGAGYREGQTDYEEQIRCYSPRF